MLTFYSQQGEDIYIYNNFINKVTNDGVFIELGAMNGIVYSNTKFFEDTLHFSGTLIEPTNSYYELIQNRPNCKCHNIAINYTQDNVEFMGTDACAGMVKTMSESFKNIWHKNSFKYYVNGCPIKDIIIKDNITYIDLITIDVEGGEQVVLETLNFNIPIYVICIELDNHNIEKDETCRNILKKNGFIFKKRMCINEFWINDNYFRKDILYDISLKHTFTSIREIGNFPFLAQHVEKEVEDSLKLC